MTAPRDESPSNRLPYVLSRYREHQAHLLGAVGDVRPASSRYAARVGTVRAPSIFDDLIASVTSTSPTTVEPTVVPPRSRFMVRVAQVGRPHRQTRRNYDYFVELNAKLAAQRAEDAAAETD